jgi:hypothetical protein
MYPGITYPVILSRISGELKISGFLIELSVGDFMLESQ